jgi:hypothetical protein
MSKGLKEKANPKTLKQTQFNLTDDALAPRAFIHLSIHSRLKESHRAFMNFRERSKSFFG